MRNAKNFWHLVVFVAGLTRNLLNSQLYETNAKFTLAEQHCGAFPFEWE